MITFSIETTPALFFEIATIAEIAEFYLKATEGANKADHHADEVLEGAGDSMNPQATRFTLQLVAPEHDVNKYDDSIAIVGLPGKCPEQETLEEFWQNLVDGKDVISEIPQNRWKWQDYFGDPGTGNKTNAKYGAFIKGYGKFDADFFGINGREATFLDPQHRLF